MHSLCALCGTNVATTKDHIPPKGIYPAPRDSDINFKTVPACTECNNGAAVEDEEFKVLMGISTGELQKNPYFVVDWIARTISHNKKIAFQIFSTKQDVHAHLRGPILEPAVAVTFDGEKYNKVISRMIRALYWVQQGRALGLNSKIFVFATQSMKPAFYKSMMELMNSLEEHSLNKDTFVYKFQICEDGSSIWGMQFFKKHNVFGYAEPPKT